MHKSSLFKFLVTFLLFSFFHPTLAHAQLVITEVFPAPSEGNEWVEIYNTSNQVITLSNWYLKDQLSTPTVIFTFTAQSIEPNSYLAIDLPSAKLNNSADGISLFKADGTLVNEMSYSSSETNKSWSRLPTQNTFALSEPTKGLPAPTITPSPSPIISPSPSPSPSLNASPTPSTDWWSLIKIHTVSPCPTDSEPESVTLQNTDAVAHQLENWHLKDNGTQTRAIAITTISADDTTTISWPNSMLNNSGDSATLIAPNGTTIDSLTYVDCQDGQIFPIALNQVESTSNAQPTPTSNSSPNSALLTISSVAAQISPPVSYSYTAQDIFLGTSSAITTFPDSPPIVVVVGKR